MTHKDRRKDGVRLSFVYIQPLGLKMKQVLGVSIALLLFGSGVWANLSVGSLSQNTGAWVSLSNAG